MLFINYKRTSKNKLNIFSVILFFVALLNLQGEVLGADVTVGKSVITNECGTLGTNNPLRLLDCSIFKLSKGMCCMLTITLTETIEEDGVQSIQETYKTACIILEEYNAKIIRQATTEYKKLGGDVLIECNQNYISVLYIYLLLFAISIFI